MVTKTIKNRKTHPKSTVIKGTHFLPYRITHFLIFSYTYFPECYLEYVNHLYGANHPCGGKCILYVTVCISVQ